MPIIIEDLPEISAKIQELEHIQHKIKGKTYHAYIVHIQIPELNIKYNDFRKVLYLWDPDEVAILKELTKLKKMDATITGYLNERYGVEVYWFYVPQFRLVFDNSIIAISWTRRLKYDPRSLR